MTRRWKGVCLVVAGLAASRAARADESPRTDVPNACTTAGGTGTACGSNLDCVSFALATTCVERVRVPGQPADRRCEVPCASDTGNSVNRAACSLGETCVPSGVTGQFFCKPTRFRMDANLLDQCIAYFLAGETPSLGSTNQCSLEANLNRLFDQNADNTFDIFDFNLCIRSFLEEPVCDPRVRACPSDDLDYCATDADCGDGLFCDPDRFYCVRECGFIASREVGVGVLVGDTSVGTSALDRTCTGRMMTCNRARGRCEHAAALDTPCGTDRECLSGEYCFVGHCAPTCSRALDCPDTAWFCGDNGHCRIRPTAAGVADGGASPPPFDPRNYSVFFGTRDVVLTPVDNDVTTPLVIIDLTTKREVRSQPSIGFGYRLEVSYSFKEDPKCLRPPALWSEADRLDCLISPDEEFVTPLAPFGTVFATGRPGIQVQLNAAAAARLTPGSYAATVGVIFDNGSRDRFTVQFKKLTPSGEYRGTLDINMDGKALNGTSSLALTMKVHVDSNTTTWHSLLLAENLSADVLAGDAADAGPRGDGGSSQGEDFIDLTEGFVVRGTIHGNDALPFALPGALTPGDNEIPLKGIYSQRYGTMRLVAVLDLPADFCAGQGGACTAGNADQLQVRNLFGRSIRRVVQFYGTYDEVGRRFFGVYRERIAGLVPQSQLTLDGSFVLSQATPDESDVVLARPLLPVGAANVGFPAPQNVLGALRTEIASQCDASDYADYARDSITFNAYLTGTKFPIYSDLVKFEAVIQEGLDGLAGSSHAADVLTLYDYLSGRVFLCDERGNLPANVPGTTPSAACVNQKKLRCGLAMNRVALLAAYVNYGDLTGATAGEQLFCGAALPTEGCDKSVATHRGLRTLQEHNRFHQELSQATKFQADRDISDAFFALYRNNLNPFTQGAALSFKEEKLQAAFELYDSLLGLIIDGPSAAVLFQWPMSKFRGAGNSWLKQMHVLVRDRLDAQMQLVDLRRRVFASTAGADQMLGEHLAQHEYLVQVYLMALQRQWQGADFGYAGEAGRQFDLMGGILARLHNAKNPLGISPNRVFFESSDSRTSNWHAYLQTLEGADGSGGLMAQGRQQITDAVANLKGALQDVDALENEIQTLTQDFEHQLDDLCGASTEKQVSACTRYIAAAKAAAVQGDLDLASWAQTRCIGQTQDCTDVVQEFTTGQPDMTCPLDASINVIKVRGADRPCVGGEMGRLLMQRESLHAERREIRDRLDELLLRMEANRDLQAYLDARYEKKMAMFIAKRVAMLFVDMAVKANDVLTEVNKSTKLPSTCLVIAGVALGTNCPGSILGTVKDILFIIKNGIADVALHAVKTEAEKALEAFDMKGEHEVQTEESRAQLAEIKAELSGIIGSAYANGVARLDLEVEMGDVRFRADQASSRLNDSLSLLVDHLVGRESGSVLVGNHLVQKSEVTFRRTLETAYRMVQAFKHRYNLSPAQAALLENQLFQSITLEDVQALIDGLKDYEQTYCGREAIDCDAFNNISSLRVSLRELLHPEYHDILSGGVVTTKGQQFHNLITGPQFLHREIRGAYTVDEIAIPFSVSLQQIRGAAGDQWLINPTQCNHIIDADTSVVDTAGNREAAPLALNFVGRNLDDPQRSIHYEMARGARDQLRDCHPEAQVVEDGTNPVLAYPVREQVVGYAPQSLDGQMDAPPTFVTRSTELAACINGDEQHGELIDAMCWQLFARDRSLAAPDYTLVIPLTIDGIGTGNSWISGEGLPESQRPVIEDIIVHLRYRSRPISEP
ncbi:MAG: hypothetical protein HY904_22080 [Deltaproteobacteria bacterium]|nr:hypothetical protein [Deltaproteobacteria bacterium]